MKQRAPIVQERVMPAPPDEVFRAWSDPGSLGLWMCPSEGMRPASVEVDFRVGGSFAIVMHGDRDYGHRGEYLEIVPDVRLAFTWVSDFVPPAEAETRVTVTFEPVGEDRTRLVLVHDRLPDTGTYDGHVQGWARIVALLSEQLGAPAR